jgi:hypothetical protein
VSRREEAIRALERQQSEKDSQSARLSALQSERATTATQLAAAKRNFTTARETHTDYTARLNTIRGTAVHAWIEWAFFQLQDKKAEALLDKADNRGDSNDFLPAWRDVAALSVQLGSDPLEVIAKFPSPAPGRAEEMEQLKRELANTREKFGLSFVATDSNLPTTALPFLQKGNP